TQEPGRLARSGKGENGKGGTGREAPRVTASAKRDDSGDESVDPSGGRGTERTRPRGGFGVEYKNLGKDEGRSKYDPNALTILINLDHPVVVAALGDGKVQDRRFNGSRTRSRLTNTPWPSDTKLAGRIQISLLMI